MEKNIKGTRKKIEHIIKKMDYPTKKEIWEALNKRISLKEVSKIVDDLEKSNKILIDTDGRTVWVHNPKLAKIIEDEGLKYF